MQRRRGNFDIDLRKFAEGRILERSAGVFAHGGSSSIALDLTFRFHFLFMA